MLSEVPFVFTTGNFGADPGVRDLLCDFWLILERSTKQEVESNHTNIFQVTNGKT